MHPNAQFLLAVTSIALLTAPRRWALLLLIVGVCYVPLGQALELGPFSFSVWRTLLAVGAIRVLTRSERLAGGLISLDWLVVIWAILFYATGLAHTDPSVTLVERLGKAYDALGAYFLIRVFLRSTDDLLPLFGGTAILLLPLGIEMVAEARGTPNLFQAFYGLSGEAIVRNAQIRARGPFAHPILAGTVGAVSLPLMVALWQRRHRMVACSGIVGCALMIVSSRSSGPILTTIVGLGALCAFPFRANLRPLRYLAVLTYVALDLAMQAPAYYLIARFDLTGGSTGWHRARLIQSSLEHLDEWWLVGTDITRHWMPTGVFWNPNHTDITNHYIYMGVVGGLPLMLAFIWILSRSFSLVGDCVQSRYEGAVDRQFLLWALGSALFAHALTCISVSYFDQSVFFFHLSIASVGSMWATATTRSEARASHRVDKRTRSRFPSPPPAFWMDGKVRSPQPPTFAHNRPER